MMVGMAIIGGFIGYLVARDDNQDIPNSMPEELKDVFKGK